MSTRISFTYPTSARHHVRFFPTTGPELHAVRFGASEPTLLLIHGGGDGAFIWELFSSVAARHYSTLAVDLRGHGDSGWDGTGRYKITGYIEDVIHIIEHSHIGNFILIGHSLGAQLAIHLRVRFVDRVLASVLVDFAPELHPDGRKRAVDLLRESLQFYPTVDQYSAWLKQTRPLASTTALAHIAASALRAEGDGFRLKLDPALADAFPQLDAAEVDLLLKLLRLQTCPTLVVRGAGSALVTPTTARRLLEVLPRGELAIVNAAGHGVMVDNPVEFEGCVLAFLKRVPAHCHSKF